MPAPRIARVRQWLVRHAVLVGALTGTALGVGLFILPGHAQMEPANLLLAASCGAVFGVTWWVAARGYGREVGEEPDE